LGLIAAALAASSQAGNALAWRRIIEGAHDE
jgi:hypothetical protein